MGAPDIAGEVEHAIAGLAELDRAALLGRWREAFPGPVPRHLSRALMVRALAWRMQASTFGGFSPTVERRLMALSRPSQRQGVRAALSGARLVREWNGRTHVVDVADDGYLWQGRRFRSLSAIAREITGAHWSGPRFFGLDKRRARP